MFQELTGFIERLDSEEHGNWVIDKENDGSPGHPIQMPYVNYGREAIAFEDAVYKFVDEHPEYDMKNYGEILEKAGIEWGTNSMEGAIVDDLDAKTVLALLIGAIRADRFCEGALLGFMKSGAIQRWLGRLKELDL